MAILLRVVRASAIVVLLLATFGAAAGQSSPSPQDSHGAVANKTQPHSEQAYSLPPDKLAQAIALNKIRVSLDIADVTPKRLGDCEESQHRGRA